ncbi:hypothetical protein [Sphingomonas asaccharolytica]|uniref:hypothetical protein n=1 Tax=Sphingomonas asaccharolytica TaxID=40681 RepID=UPI00083712D0|nr:hypothetical protein [Sphingomonas asaccharolytica]
MFAITTKLLGYLSGGLGAAALAASAFAGLQTYRMHAAHEQNATLTSALVKVEAAATLAIGEANARGKALTERDGIIKLQSDSIDGLKSQSDADRAAYIANILKAEDGAKGEEARAAEIVKLPAPAPGDRCEAARALIEQELLNVR